MPTISDTILDIVTRELWDLGHHARSAQLSEVHGCDLAICQRFIAELRNMGRIRTEPESQRGGQYFYTALYHPDHGWTEPTKDARDGTGWRDRTCLRCGESFPSESPANRRCGNCATQVRNAQDMPVDRPGWEYVSA